MASKPGHGGFRLAAPGESSFLAMYAVPSAFAGWALASLLIASIVHHRFTSGGALVLPRLVRFGSMVRTGSDKRSALIFVALLLIAGLWDHHVVGPVSLCVLLGACWLGNDLIKLTCTEGNAVADVCQYSLRPAKLPESKSPVKEAAKVSESAEGPETIKAAAKTEFKIGKGFSRVIHALFLILIAVVSACLLGVIRGKSISFFDLVTYLGMAYSALLLLLSILVPALLMARIRMGWILFCIGMSALALGCLLGAETQISLGAASQILSLVSSFISQADAPAASPSSAGWLLGLLALSSFAFTLVGGVLGSLRHRKFQTRLEKDLEKLGWDQVAPLASDSQKAIRFSDGYCSVVRPSFRAKTSLGESDGWVSRIPCFEDSGCVLIRSTDLGGHLSEKGSRTVEHRLSRLIPHLLPSGSRGPAVNQFRDAFAQPWDYWILRKEEAMVVGKLPWDSPDLLMVPLSKTVRFVFPAGTGLFNTKGYPAEVETDLMISLRSFTKENWNLLDEKTLRGQGAKYSSKVRAIRSTALTWTKVIKQAAQTTLSQECEITFEGISVSDGSDSGKKLSLGGGEGKRRFSALLVAFMPPEIRDLVTVQVERVEAFSAEREACAALEIELVALEQNLPTLIQEERFKQKLRFDKLVLHEGTMRQEVIDCMNELERCINEAGQRIQLLASQKGDNALKSYAESGVGTRHANVLTALQEDLERKRQRFVKMNK